MFIMCQSFLKVLISSSIFQLRLSLYVVRNGGIVWILFYMSWKLLLTNQLTFVFCFCHWYKWFQHEDCNRLFFLLKFRFYIVETTSYLCFKEFHNCYTCYTHVLVMPFLFNPLTMLSSRIFVLLSLTTITFECLPQMIVAWCCYYY